MQVFSTDHQSSIIKSDAASTGRVSDGDATEDIQVSEAQTETTQEQVQEQQENQQETVDTQDKPQILDQNNAQDLSDEEIDASDAPKSLKTALKRANRRLRRERQKSAELGDRLGKLEDRFSSIDTQQQEDQLLGELQEDLGLDTDQTKKLYNAVDRIVERKVGSNNQDQSSHPNLTAKEIDFVNKVNEVKGQYEDFNEMSPYMQKVMESEMKSLNDLGLDPTEAYNESVHSYYAKAVRMKAQEDAAKSRNEIVNKVNEQNNAVTESSVDGVGAPVETGVINQKVWEKNRYNPAWVKQNRAAILRAHQNGSIKA